MQNRTNPGDRLSEEEIRRRRKRAKAERMRRKRRLRRLLILAMILILAAIIGIAVLIYRNTYTGVVNQGKRAEVNGNDTKAEALYLRAIDKNGEKAEAYFRLADLYHSQNQDEKADALFRRRWMNIRTASAYTGLQLSIMKMRNRQKRFPEF